MGRGELLGFEEYPALVYMQRRTGNREQGTEKAMNKVHKVFANGILPTCPLLMYDLLFFGYSAWLQFVEFPSSGIRGILGAETEVRL
jgi:hypothetical protein